MTEAKRHSSPPIWSTGIDATDVTFDAVFKFFKVDRAKLEQRALEAARLMVQAGTLAAEQLTPDLLDPIVAKMGKQIEKVTQEGLQELMKTARERLK